VDRNAKFITADVDDNRYASLNLVYDSKARRRFLSVDGCRPKKTEQNFIVRIGKSESEVTNNKIRRSGYCTDEANY